MKGSRAGTSNTGRSGAAPSRAAPSRAPTPGAATSGAATSGAARSTHARPPAGLSAPDAAETAAPELAQAILAGTPDAIVVVDDAGRIAEFNPAAEHVFGLNRAEALGQDMIGLLVPARRRRAYRAALARFSGTGDQEALRRLHRRSATSALRADGTEFSVESTVLPLAAGGARFCCEVIRDTSDLTQATSALAESEQRFRLLSTLAPVGILQTDADGKAVFVNDRWCALTGLTADEALRQGWAGVLDPECADFVEAVWMDAQHAGEEFQAEIELRSRPGSVKWIEGTAVPLQDASGRIVGYLGIMADISARKAADAERETMLAAERDARRIAAENAERLLTAELKARKATEAARRKLDEQNKRLRELDELKTQFMTTLSHELRSPLTSIVSFTELLKDAKPPPGPQAAEFLDIIERNSDRLLRLVSDLLLLGHLETGSLPLDLAKVSAADLTEEAIRARSAPAYRRGITIEFAADDGPPLRIDRLRMLQVLDNLISNAIKFTEPGGTITVTARCDGDEWRIDVADSGIGIPAEDQDKIFDRFFRAANARIEAVPGTGLGLSVVQAIVDVHGGRLAVQSIPGKGSTFSLYLRAAR
ncbi:MAG TPA: PAS domain-containing sensor histidine kinase [Streptosporangiaceae bacterium]|nr:PAS domain-containing sensor histidine kinase [Streptosporangiaceae bacterium]